MKKRTVSITLGPKVQQLLAMKMAMVAFQKYGQEGAEEAIDGDPENGYLLTQISMTEVASLLATMKVSDDFKGMSDEELATEAMRLLGEMANGAKCLGCGKVHGPETHPHLQIFNTQRN